MPPWPPYEPSKYCGVEKKNNEPTPRDFPKPNKSASVIEKKIMTN